MENMNVTGPFATAAGLDYKQIVGTAINTPGISTIDQDYVVDSSLVINEFCHLASKPKVSAILMRSSGMEIARLFSLIDNRHRRTNESFAQ